MMASRAAREPQEGLDRVRQDRDSEQKNEIDDDIRNPGYEVVAENSVMREPEDADDGERNDERAPPRRVENLRRLGRNIEARGEERKAEAEDQIAEGLEAMGETFAKHRGRG